MRVRAPGAMLDSGWASGTKSCADSLLNRLNDVRELPSHFPGDMLPRNSYRVAALPLAVCLLALYNHITVISDVKSGKQGQPDTVQSLS